MGLILRGSLSDSGGDVGGTKASSIKRVPIIDVTDLYHPNMDVGDNFDLIVPLRVRQFKREAMACPAKAS